MKKNGKLRPLGIPTIKDRVYQNIVRNALEPQWEARFEAISYGFRPKRSTHDAIRSIFNRINGAQRRNGYLKEIFRAVLIISTMSGYSNKLLTSRKKTIEAMAQDGIHGAKLFAETQEGTPQGGIISPLSLTLPFMEWKKPWELLTRKTIKLMIVIL